MTTDMLLGCLPAEFDRFKFNPAKREGDPESIVSSRPDRIPAESSEDTIPNYLDKLGVPGTPDTIPNYLGKLEFRGHHT